MRRIFYLIIIAISALQSCKKSKTGPVEEPPVVKPPVTTVPYVSDKSFKIVAYFYYGRDPESVELAKYKMMTHLNYAFLYPNADGSLQALSQPARFQTVMSRARQNGVKTAISLSGEDATYLTLSASASTRTVFVKNVLKFAIDNNLDGIDMDWEYPCSNNGSSLTYEALMVELADSLHKKNKFLSAAVTAGVYAGAVRDGITANTMAATDFFNIMVYDGAGWDKDDIGQHSTYKMAEASLDIWINTKGMPKEKAILGFPAYGKQANNNALLYRDLLLKGADPVKNSFSVDGVMYYYNGTDLIKQKALLAKNRANGMMVWELYQDASGPNSLLKAVNDALGRPY
ncbi:Chitinase A1 precursor [compost metagenome]